MKRNNITASKPKTPRSSPYYLYTPFPGSKQAPSLLPARYVRFYPCVGFRFVVDTLDVDLSLSLTHTHMQQQQQHVVQ